MAALEDRGLAEVAMSRVPYRRLVYRLTPAGVQRRDDLPPERARTRPKGKSLVEALRVMSSQQRNDGGVS